jgi:hypothetical protein
MQGNNQKAKAEEKANTKQTLLTQPITRKRNQFYSDMCKVLAAKNICWNAIENRSLKHFLEKKFCNQIIPFEPTL